MTTAIIATSNASIEYLCWCLFSLAYRSNNLSHVIVNINGGDSRTVDTSLQDQKEAFLQEFKQIAPFEISIVRSWSRVGFSQPIKMSLPLVKTETYVSMHDDVMILDPMWVEKGHEKLKSTDLVCVWPKYVNLFNVSSTLIFPRSNTQFVLTKTNSTEWQEYYLSGPFTVDQEFFDFHTKDIEKILTISGKVELNSFNPQPKYEHLHIPPGYLIFSKNNPGYFDPKTVLHFSERSTKAGNGVAERNILLPEVAKLEKEITLHGHQDLYAKYVTPKERFKTVVKTDLPLLKPNQDGFKILVCLGVYDRYFMAKHWLTAYSRANCGEARLMVIHHVEPGCSDECSEILQEHADWYVVKPNIGFGTGMLQYAFDCGVDWDLLLWSTDDTLPMQRDFISAMTLPFKDGKVAITYPVYSESSEDKERVRTNAFCIRREIANQLKFLGNPILTKDDGRAFEFGPYSMQNQVQEAGFTVQQVVDAMRDFDWYNWGEMRSWKRFIEEFGIDEEIPDFRNYKEKENNIYLSQKTNWWDHSLDDEGRMKWFKAGLAGSDSKSRKVVKEHIIDQGHQSMLDCGAGPCLDWPNYKDVIDYRACDFAERWEKQAAEKGIPFLRSSIEDIKLPDNSVDVTYCRHVLEHLYFYEKALTELIRVASKEVVVIFFNMNDGIEWDNTCILDSGDETVRFYNNQYSPRTVEKFVLKNPKVQEIKWQAIEDEGTQYMLYIKLREIS